MRNNLPVLTFKDFLKYVQTQIELNMFLVSIDVDTMSNVSIIDKDNQH